MIAERKRTNKKSKRAWLWILPVILLAGGGSGYYYWTRQAKATVQASGPSYSTAQVRLGSLTLSAIGSGTLVAGKTAQLSFPIAGKVSTVNVRVGDTVTEGQVLAELEDLTTLQASVASTKLDLALAEDALRDLTNQKIVTLANAQIALLDAQKAYDTAKSKVKSDGMTRCTEERIKTFYSEYTRAKERYEEVLHLGSGDDWYVNKVVPAKDTMDKALATYNYCQGYTDYEIDMSHEELTVAEANLSQAQSTFDLLQENEGIDPTELAKAENTVATAQLAYTQAQEDLDGAVLKAPFAGTILTVAGEAGDPVGMEVFIALIDLYHPRIEFSVDETDLDLVEVGETAEVVFDALPDEMYTGTVLWLNPSLTSSGGYQVLRGAIELDMTQANPEKRLLEGLNATVEIINGKAENVLLVPVEAVRDLGDGTYAVFVVGSDGKPRLTVVEVGLTDGTYTEITSGLEAGDVVTTGAVETE